MLHSEITSKIIQACFEVSNELGIGYLESVYENALFVALQQNCRRDQSSIRFIERAFCPVAELFEDDGNSGWARRQFRNK